MKPESCCILHGGDGAWAFASLSHQLSKALWIDISESVKKMELPDEIYAEIQRLCDEGNALEEQGDLMQAIAYFERAWDCLPEPKRSS